MCPPKSSRAYSGTYVIYIHIYHRGCDRKFNVLLKVEGVEQPHLGDVAQEHFTSARLDPLETHHDPGAPARLSEQHARGVHPNARPAHIRRAPLVRPGVPRHRATRQARKLHRVAWERDARDARVQCSE